MDDPYQVLGVSRDATDEEIKRAYRALAKKYHPDLHPGDEAAAKKMQQINAAYEQIKNPEKASGPSYGSSPYGSYDPFGGAWQQQREQPEENPYLRSAYQYIRFGRYQEALNALENCGQRSARWYYLSALANDGMGNQVTALEHIRRAVSMEPDNPIYLHTLEELESGGSAYRRHTGSFRGFDSRGGLCPSLCLCYFLQYFCFRGRFFFCC